VGKRLSPEEDAKVERTIYGGKVREGGREGKTTS
jgi:hypothetical protein